jgi:hypothetical protein
MEIKSNLVDIDRYEIYLSIYIPKHTKGRS